MTARARMLRPGRTLPGDRDRDLRPCPAASPGMILELDTVTKTYPGEPPVAALRGVSFAVAPGELVAIVGPSDRASRRCCT